LEKDAGWSDAVADCEYVLHVASPVPTAAPKHDDDIIVPARDGTLRVLRAARDANVRRVVLTSSFAAVGYGHPPRTTAFDESSWTNLEVPGLNAYVKSKTIAERAAWDFVASTDRAFELTAINPVGVFGPVLGPDFSASIELIRSMMKGAMPGVPKLHFGAVDVRDVADLHVRAMTDPRANGERFLATAGDFISMLEIAKILKANLGSAASKVPARELPNGLVRFAALFSGAAKQAVPELGKWKNASSEKARRVLGWLPRSNEESIVAAAKSLINLGLIKAH
ncbi:MAG TPA: NAD-dependent epimerase/dehydratase family protein, partial [Steroidobacteraceae bacterium]|nr:NAD-dependent epimerase/dehydratase family protein [Steroidobacteraceae bacterium]